MKNTFYIIDGHSQIYRAYFARMHNLTSSTGEPVKATYVFTRMLMKLLSENEITHIAMPCDSKRCHLHRKKLFPAYKANRDNDTPEDDLIIQIKRCKQVAEALGVKVLMQKQYEADDIIAGLCRRWKDDANIVIVSRDKDLEQLMCPTVSMYDPMSNEWYTEADMLKKRGCTPDEWYLSQCLMGDPGDNVPGVPGIGEKTALKLLRQYKTLENIYDNLDEINERHADALEASVDQVELNRYLVGLHTPSCVDDYDISYYQFDMPNYTKAKPLFRMLGFKRWT